MLRVAADDQHNNPQAVNLRVRGLLASAVFLLAAGSSLQAAPTVSTGVREASARFGFMEAEIIKVGWKARDLRAADMDGDGRCDVVLINNDKARIDILLQETPGATAAERSKRRGRVDRWEPVLEDSRFTPTSLLTKSFLNNLAVGDVNGDGRNDVVCTDSSKGLRLYLQKAPEQKALIWDEPVEFHIEDPSSFSGTLQVVDLDGKAPAEIIAFSAKELLVLTLNDQGHLEEVERLSLADPKAYGLQVLDLNGDDRKDLFYIAPTRSNAGRIRLQSPLGRFGPEKIIPVEQPGGLFHRVSDHPESGAMQFIGIERAGGLLETLRLAIRPIGERTKLPHTVEAFSVPARASDKVTRYAWGDFNGDGKRDLAASDYKGARIFFFLQGKDGSLQSPVDFPSYSGITALSTLPAAQAGSADSLIVCSAGEEVVGLTALTPEGRLPFPKPLACAGTPQTAVALISEAGRRIVCISKDGSKRQLERLTQAEDGSWTADPEPMEISQIKSDADEIRVMDVNQDGEADLGIVVRFKPLVLLLAGKDEEGKSNFSAVKTDAGYAKSLLDKVTAGQIGSADVDGDGKDEMLICRKGFVRALRVNAEGDLEVVEQFNASNPDVEIAALIDVPQAEGPPLRVLVDASHSRFEILARGDDGAYHLVEVVDTPELQINSAFTEDLNGDGSPELFFMGNKRFWRFGIGEKGYQLETVTNYETDLRGMRYGFLAVGDLNGDGQTDITAVDNNKTRIMEVLSCDPLGAIESEMHFTVFESSSGQAGNSRDPRQALIEDFTDDGKKDLLLLVHDRVLLYPQE